METREIERPEWSRFLAELSRRHEGSLVTIEEVGMPIGLAAVQARALPLEGVSTDPEGTIVIAVGGTPERHLTHSVTGAAKLVLEATEDGVGEAIRIDRRDYEPSTRIVFGRS